MMIKFMRFMVGLSVIFVFTSYGLTQVSSSQEEKKKAEELKLQQDILKYREFQTKLLEQSYEKAIDPKTYIIGPGDYFSFTIWGDIQKTVQLPVNPEGLLVIPDIGVVKVDGLTLRQAQSVVEEAALRRYKDVPVSLNLMMMRKIRVHVTGEVLNPGTLVATPIDRLSDLLVRAGGLKMFANPQNVQIRHGTGSIDTVDFSAFLKFGNVTENPFVRGGDVIFVPTFDPSSPTVRVTGMVKREGLYSLEPDETLKQFIQRNGLFAANQNVQAVELIRHGKTVAVLDLTRSSDLDTKLQDGDVLHFPADGLLIYVIGAVQKPGPYPYYSNYNAADYIGRAGATENGAGLSGARVRHKDTGKTEKASNAMLRPGDVIEVPLRASRRWSEYLQIASQLATIVIAYYATRR